MQFIYQQLSDALNKYEIPDHWRLQARTLETWSYAPGPGCCIWSYQTMFLNHHVRGNIAWNTTGNWCLGGTLGHGYTGNFFKCGFNICGHADSEFKDTCGGHFSKHMRNVHLTIICRMQLKAILEVKVAAIICKNHKLTRLNADLLTQVWCGKFPAVNS